ncbi:MAG: orotidine-5'-phosphate decarboxylase [Rhodospirillales bacterium]|nr:orotidine-5'-phosphate decarboxylase [Rhodospirillales bacterium]
MKPSDRIFVALDTVDVEHAVALARQLKGTVGGVKIGAEFFTASGPDGFERVAEVGLPVFLDLKFHDIPNTVERAVRAAIKLKPFMLNVHAMGGEFMLRAAAAAAEETAAEAGIERPLVLAVTVLTSLSAADLAAMGISASLPRQVTRLAVLARDCGLDGVVCSCAEIMALRGACGARFKLIVPGIRPSWAAGDDHKRMITPADAIALGADYLVIGRPIIRAADPAEAARRICDEIACLSDAAPRSDGD